MKHPNYKTQKEPANGKTEKCFCKCGDKPTRVVLLCRRNDFLREPNYPRPLEGALEKHCMYSYQFFVS